MIPEDEDFEIFRLHFDTYSLRRATDEPFGELLRRFRVWREDSRHHECFVSIEHLWGGVFADREGICDKLEAGTWKELMHACPVEVALPRELIGSSNYIGYLPHPGMRPVFTDEIARDMGMVEIQMRQEMPHTTYVM